MKCTTIAEGILSALETVKVKVPIVVRLAGTEADKATQLIKEFSEGKGKDRNIKLIAINDFDKAAS